MSSRVKEAPCLSTPIRWRPPANDGRLRTIFADEGFTQKQLSLRDRVREYVSTVVVPARRRLDAVRKPEDFPWDVVKLGCELGLKGLPFPAEHGGSDADVATLAMVVEELAAGDLSIAYFFKHNWRFSRLVQRLPERLRGDIIRRICVEPEYLPATAVTEIGCGSDNHVLSDDPAVGLRFSAVPDGDGWVLNGTKMMITNARMAGIYFVSARTDPTVPVSAGATMFAVPADTEGISYGEPYDKLGQRASIQCDVHFTGCRIPGDLAVSGIGEAMGTMRRGANIGSNLVNAAMSVGVARSAFQEALQWSTQRLQGGALICTHQVVSRDLGLMKVDIEAAQSYVLRAARLCDAMGRNMDEATAHGANVFASEMVLRVARLGMEMFGGRGMMGEWPAEKIMRDALTLQHGFGTNPLMLISIGTAAAEQVLQAG